MQAKIGDTVRFLNSVGGGRLVRIEGQIAYVDEDGFETPVLLRECVPVASENSFKEPEVVVCAQPPKPTKNSDPAPEMPFVETQSGERLNIVLAFEPRNIRQLSQGDIDAYLVNDSNYYLYVCFSTRPDRQSGWTTRYAGVIEPGIQVLCGEFHHADLPMLEEACVQYLAFKKSASFTLKPVCSLVVDLEPSKFARLHCFKSNPYFDGPVLAYDITVDDEIQHRRKPDAKALQLAMQEKRQADAPAKKKAVKKHDSRHDSPLVIDLHATELLDNLNGLSNADILNYQIDRFREVMDANLRNKGMKLVFIHGKGEGVLRQAIMKELNHRYKGHQVQDASFREYGYGATQVTI
ncbi:MAG: DUF2027 domain-containing protein [Muribaculaceae bacterium]|nr:DUF2027 domain-containing protein [Muribaculaceae bacterium]